MDYKYEYNMCKITQCKYVMVRILKRKFIVRHKNGKIDMRREQDKRTHTMMTWGMMIDVDVRCCMSLD